MYRAVQCTLSGIEADAAIYNTLINACAGAGDLDKVVAAYVNASVLSHTCNIFLCMKKALDTVRAMQEDGIAPDVITYTSLIKACAIQGGEEAAGIAESLFLGMQQRTNHFSSYVEPNELVSY